MDIRKIIADKVREINDLIERSFASDSKKETKELNDKVEKLTEEVEDLIQEYLEKEIPESMDLKFKVEKIIKYDTFYAMESFKYDILEYAPEDIENLNIKSTFKDYIKRDADPISCIDNDDIQIIIDD